MSNATKGPFMQAMEKYTKSIKTFISAQGFGHYSKPSGGIPKADLEQSVQTSLGLADSALQEFSETDPTVPAWAKQTSKPSYHSDEISDTNKTHRFATAEQLQQISTNQTNILYGLNMGVKNKLPCKIPNNNPNDTGLKCSYNENGTYTVTGTKSTSDSYLDIENIYADKLNGDHVAYISVTGTGTCQIAAYGWNGTKYTLMLSTSSSQGFNIGNYTHVLFRIRFMDSVGASYNATVKAMVCTMEAWNQSHDWQPPALPNTDLTRGLAELNAHPFLTVPVNHNMVYRGQNLGDTLTDAQHIALSSGNFTDLYLGDYWTKTVTIPAGTYTGGDGQEVTVPAQTNITLKAVIADFDTFYAGYASGYAGINTHHAAVIITGFSNVVWNKTNSTAGGYKNSLIHKWLDGSALSQIEAWFGSDKVLWHKKLLTTAITGDAASNWNWSDQKISLLSENQMYGSKVWGNSKAANGGYEPGEAFKHLNVFNHIDANLLFGNKNIWLRDIASAVWAAHLSNGGLANSNDASVTWVAPAALILLS